jgi:hypothetical protein
LPQKTAEKTEQQAKLIAAFQARAVSEIRRLRFGNR